MPTMDLNNAPDQREFGATIPNGTFVLLQGNIKPGGASHPLDPAGDPDTGLYKMAKAPSDVMMLEWDFTVIGGPFNGRHLFENMVITGGSVDENGRSKAGEISRGRLKAMVNSAMGLDPKDNGPQATAARTIQNMRAFDGISPIAALIGVEEDPQYGDKNYIYLIAQPGDEEYAPLRAGQEVPPRNIPVRKARAQSGHAAPADKGTPAWQRAAAPTQAPAAAPSVAPRWGNGATPAAPAVPPAAAQAPTPAPAVAPPSWVKPAGM